MQLKPKVLWQIKGRCKPYDPVSGRCNLCLNKTLKILDDREHNLLNTQSKVIPQCRHQNKFEL